MDPDDGVTLLRRLLTQRRLTREELRERLRERATSMGIERFAVELRQLDRWLSGTVKTLPHPTACRVLEAEFGHPVEQLLAAAPAELPPRPAPGPPATTGPDLLAALATRGPALDGPAQDVLSALQLRLADLAAQMQEEINLALLQCGVLASSPDGHAARLAPAAARACQIAGLRPHGMRSFTHGTGAAFLLPEEAAVATVACGAGATVRARLAVIVSEHLASAGLPVVEPLPIPSGRTAPIVLTGAEDIAVTFWSASPPTGAAVPGAPGTRELADLLRGMHALDPPATCPLPRYRPLAELEEALAEAAAADAIGYGTRGLLESMITRVRTRFDRMRWPLGDGLVHGDLDAGLRWDGERLAVGDWHSACIGPREVDLVRVFLGPRLALAPDRADRFAQRYGWDVRTWHGFGLLRAIDDLAAVAPLVRRCATDTAAVGQLSGRLTALWESHHYSRW